MIITGSITSELYRRSGFSFIRRGCRPALIETTNDALRARGPGGVHVAPGGTCLMRGSDNHFSLGCATQCVCVLHVARTRACGAFVGMITSYARN